MQGKVLVTGGAGFIGSNLVEYCLSRGCKTTAFDNLSRPGGGARKNMAALTEKHGRNSDFRFVQGDVRDLSQVKEAVREADTVFHFAAQTAMTTSITDPVDDFETNARGTFNVLEAARQSGRNPIIVYTSTNKVYGDLTKKQVPLKELPKRWDFAGEYSDGVDESYPLDFEGPYGCSKGIGDAYCLDYARTFGMRTVVFRMSAIYGTGQHGTEDQGWISWFISRAMDKLPVTIYGDGKQVRDVLFIADLLDAFDRATEKIDVTKGRVYNMGGGRGNSLSIIELLELMESKLNIKPSQVGRGEWRLADQKVYITNSSKAGKEFGWQPRVGREEGIRKLYEWIAANHRKA